MSIPFYRQMRYTDDGCSCYQCLNCYRVWEGRDDPKDYGWRFCPFCSVRWRDEHQCRQKDERAWLYRLKQDDPERWEQWEHQFWIQPPRRTRGWVIQCLMLRPNRTARGDWQDDYFQSDYGITSLADVISHLLHLRKDQDDCGDFVYRAIIKDFPGTPSYCSRNHIWQHHRQLEKNLLQLWKEESK